MNRDLLLLGVDGGGTRCRARLAESNGAVLGEGIAGPANIRLGVEESSAAIGEAVAQCLRQAGLSTPGPPIVACLALAGVTEAGDFDVRAYQALFQRTVVTTDAHAACIGAHAGRDGAIIIVGTGSIGWGRISGEEKRVGGWGFPISDEASGAWLGCEAIRHTLWAHDGLIGWTTLHKAIFARFGSDPRRIVRWMTTARPRDFGSVAPLVVEQAERGDPEARALMQRAAAHVEAIAARLWALEAPRLSLMGGLAHQIRPYLSDSTQGRLVTPLGDALSGALRIARAEAEGCIAGPKGHSAHA